MFIFFTFAIESILLNLIYLMDGQFAWKLQWNQYFPLSEFTDENWQNQFGVHINDVDYHWQTYRESAKINYGRDLLILLRFLKTSCTHRENATIFGLSPQQVCHLISKLLVSLSSKMKEVHLFIFIFTILLLIDVDGSSNLGR